MVVAVEQLRNLGTYCFKSSPLEPVCTRTAQMRRAELKLGNWGEIVVTRHTAHMARVRCEAGIKCIFCTEKQEGPTLVAQKYRHKFHISLCSKVRRHRDTKRQSGLPNLLLVLSVSMTSAYSNLGVSQGLEPPTSATNSVSLPLSHISCGTIHVLKKVK